MAVDSSGASFEPSASRVTLTSNYVHTTDIAALNLQKQDVNYDIVKKYGNQGLSGYLEALGAVTAVGSDEFKHFEERMLHEELVLASSSSIVGTLAAAKNEATFVLSSSATRKYIRKNAVIQFQNGDLAIVTDHDVTGQDTQFKATPVTTWSEFDTNAGTTAAAMNGYKLIVIGLEFGKGTDQPTSIEPIVDDVVGRTAIYKESFLVNGSDATQIVHVKVDNGAGKSGYVWYIKGEGDTRRRFEDYCEASLMFGKKKTNDAASLGIDGLGITGQDGLLTQAEAKGMTDLSGTMLTDARVDAWVDAIDRQRGPAEYTAWCGLDVSLALDDWMASKNQTTGIGEQNWGAFNNSKDMAMNFGFESFTRGGYTFHKKLYDMFNDRGMGGSLGYRKKALFVPSGVQKDPRSGLNIPALQIRYREANGYSRKMEHWFTGSAVLANPTSTSDALNCHYRTERGLKVFGANRYLSVSVA
jgi:hypothetical protein